MYVLNTVLKAKEEVFSKFISHSLPLLIQQIQYTTTTRYVDLLHFTPVADASGVPLVYSTFASVTCDSQLRPSLSRCSGFIYVFIPVKRINVTSASLKQLVPCPVTNNQPTPTTKIPAAAVDATCFCAVSILFVVSLLTLIVVAAIAVAAILLVVAIAGSFLIVIAVATLVAVTGDFLRRFAVVRNFRSLVFFPH